MLLHCLTPKITNHLPNIKKKDSTEIVLVKVSIDTQSNNHVSKKVWTMKNGNNTEFGSAEFQKFENENICTMVKHKFQLVRKHGCIFY